MNQPEILITGATGTNGSELIRQLAGQGVSLRAMVRDISRAGDLDLPGVELVTGDFSDPASLDAAMQGIKVAFIVTSIDRQMPDWHRNFFDAAKRAGVARVVKFSGYAASADSPCELIRLHAESDRKLIDSSLSYTILRPNSFMQNMLWAADSIREQGAFHLPMADARQSVIDVRDIAEVAAKVMTEPGHENQIYQLTGPEALSYHDIAAKIGTAIGKTVNYIAVPSSAAEEAMKGMGMPDWLAQVLAEFQDTVATGAYADTTDTVVEILGRPARSFDDFAADFAAAFK